MNLSSILVRTALVIGFLAVAASLAIACLPFSAVRSRLDQLSGDGSADAYTAAIHSRFRLAGMGGAAAACGASLVLWRNRRSAAAWLDRRSAGWNMDFHLLVRAMRRSAAGSVWLLIVIGVVAIAIRLPHCNQPVSYDEAHTFNNYAKWPLPLVVTRYNEPNNHVFHSVLMHCSYRLWGDSRIALRVPAFLCGILVPLLTVLLARRAFDSVSAAAAGLLTAVMPQLVFYSVNARGYTIATALFLSAILASRLALRRNNTVAWLLLVAAMALAIWTLPTMVYAAIGLFVWMLLLKRRSGRDAKPVVFAAVGTLAAATLLYLPIALTLGAGRMASVGGSYSKPLGQFLAESPEALLRVVEWFGWTIPNWCDGLIGVGAGVAAVATFSRRNVLPAMLAAGAILPALVMQRIEPPARVWIFAAPLICIAAAAGFVAATRRLPVGWRDAAPLALAVVITMGISVSILRVGPVLWSPETAIFPEAEHVTRKLAQLVRDKEPIITVTPASSTIIYNAPHQGLAEIHFMPPGRGYTNDETAIVVTSRQFEQAPLDVLEELQLLGAFDPSTAQLIERFDTGALWRVNKR